MFSCLCLFGSAVVAADAAAAIAVLGVITAVDDLMKRNKMK